LVERELSYPVTKCVSGPLGGDQQIGALIVDAKVDILIFFWDPLSAQPHDPDVKALLRIAALYEIPVACNRATADFLLQSLLLSRGYERRCALATVTQLKG
jgi:methylglyoxal synthase